MKICDLPDNLRYAFFLKYKQWRESLNLMMTSFATRPKMAKVRFPGRGSRQRPLVSDSEIIDSLPGGCVLFFSRPGQRPVGI